MPIKLLSNIDLQNHCRRLGIPLHYVGSKNSFIQKKPKLGAYIINMDTAQGPGTHWTALILRPSCAVYYDSFGLAPPPSILAFVRRFPSQLKVIHSSSQIQALPSTACGWYCLFFLHWFSVKFKTTTRTCREVLNRHNAIFSLRNRYLNEQILQALIKRL